MSAFGDKADIVIALRNVRFWPKADIQSGSYWTTVQLDYRRVLGSLSRAKSFTYVQQHFLRARMIMSHPVHVTM
jgi:hypothetical protein